MSKQKASVKKGDKLIILSYENGAVWGIPLAAIASQRAEYYAKRDKDTTYKEEFDYVMNDDYEGIDWFANNMNWEDIEDVAFEIDPPQPFDPSDMMLLEDRFIEDADKDYS